MIRRDLIISIAGIMLFGCAFGQNVELDDGLDYVPGEVIIKYKNTKSSRSLSSLDTDSDFGNLEIKEQLDDSENIVLIEINDDKTVEEVIESLQGDPSIEYAEPNYIRYLFYLDNFTSSDPGKGNQWGLDSISWADGYNAYSGKLQGGAVKVGVIDNGISYNHPDLKDSMWSGDCIVNGETIECEHGYDFFHDTTTPLPNEDTHGTHVAGIIAAGVDNGKGIIGVNPHAKLVALKVGRSKQFTTADEIRAINFAIDNGIKIINASYGSKASSDLEKDAIERFGNAGGLFVTAAGNDYLRNLDGGYSTYPCKYDLDNIICVAAIDRNGGLADYTNYGKQSVDVAAPGSSIYSTIVIGTTMRSIYSGTFEGCRSSSSIPGWIFGECFKWASDYGYGYQFTGSITSPSFNLSDGDDIYISFSIACDTNVGVDVDVQYSTGDGNYVNAERIGKIGKNGTRYTLSVGEDYYADNFSFRLNAFEDSEAFNEICVIDDVDVYGDPYVTNDNDRYGEVSGTSMATPHVAGLASMIWALNPKLSNVQVKEFIMNYGDDNTYCAGKTVSGKTINVKKTLDAVMESIVAKPDSLVSSWTGFIQWGVSADATGYYYEVLDGENIVLSGYTILTGVETNLTGNYQWRVQALDDLGNNSVFSNSYICEKPELHDLNISGLECSNLVGDFGIDNNCMSMYNLVWVSNEGLTGWEFTRDYPTVLSGEVYIENEFGERTDEVSVYYSWENSLPTMNINSYSYSTTITNGGELSIGDVVSIFGVLDGVCGSGKITATSVSCDEGGASLNSNVLKVNVPTSKEGSSQCEIEFKDDEGFSVTGAFTYSFNTVPAPSTGGGGGGGSTSYSCKNLPTHATANNNKTPSKADTDYTYSTSTSKVCTFQCDDGYGWNATNSKCEKVETQEHNAANTGKETELQKPTMVELLEEETKKSGFDFSWYNTSNPNNLMPNGYTVEFNNAYEFAHRAGITTTNSIESANMGGKLTRIAMAKMLSNYAINILGKKPANKVVPKFSDVSAQLNADYGGAVDLAYQLGIMGVGIDNFRPNDVVTRGEFATALSRMLYGTSDGTPYYSTHLSKLYREGIITNSDPKIKELRGYVMIMLMRSAKN